MRAKILVADDSATMRMIVTSVLEEQGWEVRAASDGREALMMAREQRPDLVVTDWNMPIMGGLEVVQWLRACDESCGVPILVLSTEDDAQSQRAARQLDVNGWLYKPVDPALLVQTVAAYLGGDGA